MKKILTLIRIALVTGLLALAPLAPASARTAFSPLRQDAPPTETPAPDTAAPTADSIIRAVNALRLAHGLSALAVHPVLMAVAQQQANALAASNGAVGHERPCGLTLGQQLLQMGYPLSGALSLDGYRSENWVAASTTADAIRFWLGDEPHTNTMISEHRSDIGAAVAVSDQFYVVLETALQTASGQMQYEAAAILTGIPATNAACLGLATQYAQDSNLPQFVIPVYKSTALPNGDVIHEVKYGQTLWSIAIQYGTTIARIRQLNHLSSDTLQPGQKLIVTTYATQPAPGQAEPTPVSAAVDYAFIVTPVIIVTASVTAQAQSVTTDGFIRQNWIPLAFVGFSFLVLLVGLGVMRRK